MNILKGFKLETTGTKKSLPRQALHILLQLKATWSAELPEVTGGEQGRRRTPTYLLGRNPQVTV